jgi:imidazolonepropionase-like amidohydrolase
VSARSSLLTRFALLALLAPLVLLAPAGRARAADPAPAITAVEHARIHAGDGKAIEDGTLVVRGGTVAALGPAAGVTVPAGARRVDGRSLWLTPGLIDAESSAGLADVYMEKSSLETGLDDKYDAIRAAFQVIDGFNPRAAAIPTTRLEGVTSVVIVPSGGLVSGRGAAVRLWGTRVPDMTVRAPVGVYVHMGEQGRAAGYGARGGQLLRLRELLDDVRQYARRRAEFERNQMRKVAASRLDLEALLPVIEGRLPLVVEVNRAADIQAILRLGKEEKIDLVLTGVEEGWLVAADLAAARVPVILSPLVDLPHAFEALSARLDNAALLARAGVKLALSPRSRSDHFSRTLRLEAGNAVASGLPWEAALAAVTRAPAEIFGLGREVGTLAPGAPADFVLWTGDPFEPLTRPRAVYIGGQEIPRVSRQTRLRDRYRDLKGLRPAP